ncbi:MAG: transaldolase [Chloroflexi bacterium]|nr:transaldolase [Chloroflexota bacterium]
MANPLVELQRFGQSVWLDYIRRKSLLDGDVRRLIDEDGLRGMTANPTIFQQAIAAGDDYDESIVRLLHEGKDPTAIYEAVAFEDIQTACDLFAGTYQQTEGTDGFVSLEVSPSLAHDTEGSIEEARRYWSAVNRPNLMIKIPGTDEGAPAVERLLADGINVNITLLFSIANYERVAWAYIDALEQRVAKGQPIDRIASVASFFVSRVDTLVDHLLDEKAAKAPDPGQRATIERLRGRAGVANARLAYQSFERIFGDERFKALAAKGARVQRPLWASTSTKNPAYSDLLYVDSLIGPHTVNTLPRETLEAFRDHGILKRTVDEDLDQARATFDGLRDAGIDFKAVTAELEREGVQKFEKSFVDLTAGIAKKRDLLKATRA